MAVRPEEKLCAEALVVHLGERYGIASTWAGTEKDPPDLRFDIKRPDGTSELWAVEVTGLVQRYHQPGREDGGNRYDFEPSIQKVVNRLNAELQQQMKYKYALSITGPLRREVFRELEQRVRAYVQSGRVQTEALDWPEAIASVRQEIRADPDDPEIRSVIERVAEDRVQVTIRGFEGGNRIVAITGISGAATVPHSDQLAGNVQSTLDYAVNHILKEKLPRMEKVSGYDRKVLLIWKAIFTVHAEDVIAALATKTSTGLDAAFLYEDGAERVTVVLNAGLLPHA